MEYRTRSQPEGITRMKAKRTAKKAKGAPRPKKNWKYSEELERSRWSL